VVVSLHIILFQQSIKNCQIVSLVILLFVLYVVLKLAHNVFRVQKMPELQCRNLLPSATLK
jgi:hypothetical protein